MEKKYLVLLGIAVLVLAVFAIYGCGTSGEAGFFGRKMMVAPDVPTQTLEPVKPTEGVEIHLCQDSDKGPYPTIAGVVTYKSRRYADRCVNMSGVPYVNETYCSNDQPAGKLMKCNRYCTDRRCY